MSDQCARPTCDRRAYSHGYCEQHANALRLRSPYHPVSDLHKALRELERHGWTQTQISQATGISRRHLHRMQHLQEHVGEKLLTRVTKLIGTDPVGGNTRPAWPYTRRLRSLRAAGHPHQTIVSATGLNHATVSRITNNRVASGRISNETAKVIDAYWHAHYSDPVQEPDRTARGWVTPMWWDNIDNPDEEPGVSHCRECHAPNPWRGVGMCRRCNEREYKRAIRARSAA